jgi:diguanylate cyclase (GGDEF)-like protein
LVGGVMKKKNINKRKILLITLPIVLLAIIIVIAVAVNKSNNEKGVFSLLEKRWIEKNKNMSVDVSVLNDIPIFGEDGEGVFFDFLNDFSKETGIKFNMVPYKLGATPDSKYAFEMKSNSNLKDSDLLFYSDEYALVSKDNKRVKKITDLKNVTIGALETDIDSIRSSFEDNETIIYNSYNNIDAIIDALQANDIVYAVIPKTIYINEIFSNNFYIVYNISELTNESILSINGSDKTLNSIFKKYYTRWSKEELEKSYNKRLLTLYFESKEIDDVTIANFEGKEYTYGYVKNLPYESKINDEFIGYNSEILDGFAKSMNITFKVKEYNSVRDLVTNLNSEKVDLAFNYYNFEDLANNFDETVSPYKEKVVVLTHINNVNTVVPSLKSLKNKNVSMIDNKLSDYIAKEYDAKVTEYKKSGSLFSSLNENSIVILDYNVYDNYRNSELDDFKVVYEDEIDNLEYNFIVLNKSSNKGFVGLFKFYISNINPDLYMARAKVKLAKDSKKIDLTFVYILVGLFVLLGISVVYINIKYKNNKISKNDRLKYVDSLTSLKNRHYLNKNYEKWQSNKIYPQAIIIVNVNKVGHINDVYGHSEGDMVLKKAANVLINNQLEQSDIVRTNGDEFLIYLIGYEENKVIAYMRKLNKEFKTIPYGFGATLGYSMIVDDVKTIDDAINEAVLEVKTNKELNTEDK